MSMCSDKRNLLNVYQYPDPLQPITATGPFMLLWDVQWDSQKKNALRQIHPQKLQTIIKKQILIGKGHGIIWSDFSFHEILY